MASLTHLLLSRLDGAAAVSTPDGTVQMRNAAWRALDGGEAASVFAAIPEDVLAPVLNAVASGTSQTDPSPVDGPASQFVVRVDDEHWLRIRVEAAPRMGEERGETRPSDATAAAGLPWIVIQAKSDQTVAQMGGHDVLRSLIEGMRAPLASIRAAIETMTQYPDMDAAAADQFHRIIAEQTVALNRKLDASVETYADLYRAARPLEVVTADVAAGLVHRPMQDAVDVPVRLHVPDAASGAHVRLDPIALGRLFAFLAGRIVNAARCDAMDLRVTLHDHAVALDVCWVGTSVTPDRLQKWTDAVLGWGDTIVEMRVADIIDDHDAHLSTESWSATDGLRLRLPRQ